MSILLLIYFVVLGTLFGSFYNVVGMRILEERMFKTERSICPDCKQQIKAYDLIPIISYVILHGKCRNCKKHISLIYPVNELATGFLFGYSYYLLGTGWDFGLALLLVSIGAILFVTDMRFLLIPNKILLFFLPLFILLRIITPLDPWWDSIIGSVIAFILLFLVILLSRGGMGGGDLKLFVLLGGILGWKGILLTFILASVLGAVISLFLLYIRVLKRNQVIPFGPYILAGALLTFFHGDTIISWYSPFIFI
ncbi:prepilin peptidase [Terribacillus saccharophilus]|uniref:Prepilin peptidase n=1 Tax=Terribacillus saccharophilus TaxID=361277 RepID=A0A075LR33_9BACI|nr:A24 family peptidase [Terribacillus goriensis]AIF66933.1 prepilin peptidase [Terribacillus goriensis]MEC0283758.1 A24 family peptidase [Terribacillus saccharophilus]MEC0290714.1 A24 family peptidase [Terribacillus saccharophilus]